MSAADRPHPLSSLPSLSVVTVVKNGEATLDACIRSVSAQTYPNVAHIIVDGASSDGTIDILRSYDADLEYWVSEPDKGIYNALNKAVALVRGSHYVVLGCDDLLLPSAAESFMKHAYGAPISDDEVKQIGAYLAVAYGSAKETDASVVAVSSPVPPAAAPNASPGLT